MDLRPDNYRAVASWKFVLVDVAAGLGVDHYTSSRTSISFHDGTTATSVRTIVINPNNTREVLFVDGGLSLAVVKFVAELGVQTGEDQSFVTTVRDFDPKAGPVFGGGRGPVGFWATAPAAGVARVVAAVSDPDPQARGGAGVLRSKGVIVSIGLLAEAAAALNAPFFFAREQAERPFVALKLATSIDGRIADAAGSSRWVSGEAAQEYVHWLRAGFDAIAVGGMTALRDNPQLTVRGVVTPRKPPVRVVFDRRAMLNETADLVRTARQSPTWVMSSPDAPPASVALLERSGVRVFRPSSLADGLRLLRQAGGGAGLGGGGGGLGAQVLGDRLGGR